MTSFTDAPVEIIDTPALQIGDTFRTEASGGTHGHVYAATGKPTRDIPLAGRAEIDEAVAAARAALAGWRAMPADRRRNALTAMSQLIEKNAEQLATLNVIDNGTTMMIAAAQTSMASDLFAYNAGWADKGGGSVIDTWPMTALDYSLDEPYGVVGVIIPWNGPITAIGQVLGPALAAGNTIVLKPPEIAPFGALAMGKLFLEAGFPPGVVNVVPGGPEAGEALVAHPGVDKVHFTGSGATARKIMHTAIESMKPLGLELGGKSAVLVFEDADIDAAVGAASMAVTTALSGQGCILGTRVLAHRSIYDRVVDGVVAAVSQVEIGDPFDFGTTMGPVATSAACDRILSMIDSAISNHDGRLVAGGKRLGGDHAGGFFIEPTVFADVDHRSSIAQNEVFGPVQTIIPFDTEAEAVAMANDTQFGLAGYIHTHDLRRTHRVAAALEAGNIWVNGGFGIPASAPFGGVKHSGHGRIGGRAGIDEFTRTKNVWIPLD